MASYSRDPPCYCVSPSKSIMVWEMRYSLFIHSVPIHFDFKGFLVTCSGIFGMLCLMWPLTNSDCSINHQNNNNYSITYITDSDSSSFIKERGIDVPANRAISRVRRYSVLSQCQPVPVQLPSTLVPRATVCCL